MDLQTARKANPRLTPAQQRMVEFAPRMLEQLSDIAEEESVDTRLAFKRAQYRAMVLIREFEAYHLLRELEARP